MSAFSTWRALSYSLWLALWLTVPCHVVLLLSFLYVAEHTRIKHFSPLGAHHWPWIPVELAYARSEHVVSRPSACLRAAFSRGPSAGPGGCAIQYSPNNYVAETAPSHIASLHRHQAVLYDPKSLAGSLVLLPSQRYKGRPKHPAVLQPPGRQFPETAHGARCAQRIPRLKLLPRTRTYFRPILFFHGMARDRG